MAQHHQRFSQQDQTSPWDYFPASPDSITMPSPGRPADAGLLPFAQYASMPTQGHDSRELMGNLQALAGGHGQHGFAQNQGLHPMNQFMHDRGPWNPIQLTAPSQSVGIQFSQGLQSFAVHRSVPPSEADTVSQSIGGILTDSGYGSNARQSVGNPSVYGEMDPSVIARFQTMGQDDVSLKGESQKREVRGQRLALGTLNAKSIVCPDCDEPVKTPSELKPDNFRQHLRRKHGLDKVDLKNFMYRIPPPNPASVGSPETALSEAPMAPSSDSTSPPSWAGMDQGHVAPASLINGDGRLAPAGNINPYSGPLSMQERDGPTSSAVAPQYLGRNSVGSLHIGLNTEPALSGLTVPQPSPQEASASHSGPFPEPDQPTYVAPNVLNDGRFFRMFNAQTQQPMEAVRPEADNTLDISQEDVQSEVSGVDYTAADEMDLDNSAQDSASEDDQHDTDSVGNDASYGATDIEPNITRNAGAQYNEDNEVQIKLSPSQVQLGADTPRPIDLDDDDEIRASAIIQSLIEKGKLGEMLKKLGYSASEEADIKDQKPAVASLTASETGHVNKCHQCPKTFSRRCELKKHVKRHAKPYACTFAKCCKKFGSKNDWKRHENSQHFQLEIWRCAEKTADRPDQQECGKVCHRRESLKSHLEKDHGIYDQATLDKKLGDCRLGRNFESRFWCGFCQKTIEPTGKGGPAHSERFDHIDDHFNGKGGFRKEGIENWKHIDTDPVDAPDTPPGKSKRAGGSAPRVGKSRKRAHTGGGDDDAPRAKRLKDGDGTVWFWVCCSCDDYWKMGTTKVCMNGCNHKFCDNCEAFEEDVGRDELIPVRDAGQDGLMT
ncbi:hypothetical protein B0I37DRAFT_355594 [Chaetomium sp. MPI-CAGE-AT-0009]|nr:hypothetical protein B0I37DRAFT_355594 [Chaetomium sp. MPI-CAGE-AT-0009]